MMLCDCSYNPLVKYLKSEAEALAFLYIFSGNWAQCYELVDPY